MPAADSNRGDDTPELRSPKRALARSFRLSRDRWKQKANQRRQQIKALQVRVRDLEASRDLWKDKAKALHQQRWCEENIGQTLQSKRGQVYRLARLAGVTDLG